MNETEIRQLIEQIDPQGKIEKSKIEELIVAIKDMEENPPKDGDKIGDAVISIGSLKERMEAEPDWRKKAAIAAKIISLGLDT